MVIFEPIIPGILFVIFFIVWIVRKRKTSAPRVVERFLFLIGCFLVFNYYFIPLPITPVGFRAISDSLLPLNEAIRIVPFEQLIEDWLYLDYYFMPKLIMFCGAALMGFTINDAVENPFSVKKNLLISFTIPFSIFSFYAIIRLITGAMLKRADITDVIWFMLFYFIGYGIYLVASNLKEQFNPQKMDGNKQ